MVRVKLALLGACRMWPRGDRQMQKTEVIHTKAGAAIEISPNGCGKNSDPRRQISTMQAIIATIAAAYSHASSCLFVNNQSQTPRAKKHPCRNSRMFIWSEIPHRLVPNRKDELEIVRVN